MPSETPKTASVQEQTAAKSTDNHLVEILKRLALTEGKMKGMEKSIERKIDSKLDAKLEENRTVNEQSE